MDKPNFAGAACPTPHQAKETVLLGHGSGGTLSRELVEQVFLPELGEAAPRTLDDAAIIETAKQGQRLALSTDSHVVEPLFFPGGDIGHLAVCGTVNDLAMMGARPLALTCGFILEEGLPFATLRQVLASMRVAAEEAGIYFAAGDTKVVQRGSADKMFINTSGVGVVDQGVQVSGANARPGDVIIVSGTLGDHGITVLATREGLGFETDLASDAAPLNHLVQAMLAAGTIHVLRDPTRGGLATSLVEISEQSQVTLLIEEDKLPVKPAVRAACEMLGFDPLFIANEGKLVAFVPLEDAEAVLATMRQTKYGEDATIIGRVLEAGKAQVQLRTAIGGTRLLDMLPGELLPRIC
ncbi:MAG: hydrogenase expression/formation protein HypE [Candidatus Electrothrix aestuarii]|uniref:Hydrogenase expression/formation protein HypE n=1 Tax=Candidatus Electrothrix aestuarii TaxID=3062594 RepID=A0AAU8LXY1_9BACT|nr:hydrogenase expression/formation protein HypE [Candidatus Electrothrix aestuarii]